MFRKHIFMTAVIASLIATTASADAILYSDGGLDGNTTALPLGLGVTVADSFSLTSMDFVTGVTFVTWDAYTNDVTNVDWAITSSPGGAAIVSGVQTAVSSIDLGANSSAYELAQNSFRIPSIQLSAGAYWLELSNATTASGETAYWDVNSAGANPGASLSWTNQTGEFSAVNPCSNDLNIGTAQCSSPFQIIGNVPEPATLFSLVSGLIGLAASRKLKETA